jgi:hypothetical protein
VSCRSAKERRALLGVDFGRGEIFIKVCLRVVVRRNLVKLSAFLMNGLSFRWTGSFPWGHGGPRIGRIGVCFRRGVEK